jgi:hypothetical protein
MAADPNSLKLAEPWRKGTRSSSGGCVEAARVATPSVGPDDVSGRAEGDISA